MEVLTTTLITIIYELPSATRLPMRRRQHNASAAGDFVPDGRAGTFCGRGPSGYTLDFQNG
ncbi:MAG: hypothetical protein D4R74_01580 [Betaproteobacteria bacterium]|nr:MAG: hypothetical protein D4R74_01580 [Betaproteobacteria bacterium]